MEVQFVDRILICSDCHGEFIFTAGEQLFFHDKQFKNDPKRCKPCKSRRSGLSAAANGVGPAAAGLSRTETRTECSECGVQTTVPFKPTQGRPVLCRQCFQARNKAAASVAPVTAPPQFATPAPAFAGTRPTPTQTIIALTQLSTESDGAILSSDAATLAAASMALASPKSSVASAADLALVAAMEAKGATVAHIPTELLAAGVTDNARVEMLAAASPAKSSEA
jgi:CxxC-x17-CxxC domain-containing protein